MISLRPIVLAAGLALSVPALATGEAAEGPAFDQKLAACAACHGENGAKPIMAEYPIIAGQYADYLASALRAYRDGRRNNAVMASQLLALQLSDSDIDRLADHFSKQASPLAVLKAR
ncbi:MAG: c-type cytochrome [Gammaproteobacteria bacterium]|nr:c-type cytochrome [Gammaproteobacteria bacterium]